MKKDYLNDNIEELVNQFICHPIFLMTAEILDNEVVLRNLIYKSKLVKKDEKEIIIKGLIKCKNKYLTDLNLYLVGRLYLVYILRNFGDNIKNSKIILNQLSQKGLKIYDTKFGKI